MVNSTCDSRRYNRTFLHAQPLPRDGNRSRCDEQYSWVERIVVQ
ncbi:MAG: hypothetical protein AB8G22_07340 [Saprospiraceae bacterium]